MITVNSVIGNIYIDSHLGKQYEEMLSQSLCESIKVNRIELQRTRARKTSSKGSDIALALPTGTHLRHGDVVLLTREQMVTVELEPESIMIVEIRENVNKDHLIEVPLIIGHTIGNLHRPLKLEGRKIYFPLQSESEAQIFTKMFAHLAEYIDLSISRMVFEPEGMNQVHEH